MRKITTTTMIFSKLQRKNQKIVTERQPLLRNALLFLLVILSEPSESKDLHFGPSGHSNLIRSRLRQLRLFGLMHIQIHQSPRIAAQGSGGKQGIVRRHDQFGMRLGERSQRDKAGFGAHIVTAEKIEPVELVRWHQAVNFVQ